MDPMQQYLEELAVKVTRFDPEVTPEEVARWNYIFGYSRTEALVIISRLRANVNGHRLSDGQWDLIRANREAKGHSRETYAHQLQLWSSNSSFQVRQRSSGPSNAISTYIFKLGGPFPDIESLRRAVEVWAEARSGQGEEGDTEFACVNGAGKRVIENWLETQSPPISYRPTFIRLSWSPKNLSENSSHPTLGIDCTLPQHRMQDINRPFAPAQNECPVWYFFYGTLMDPQTLQKCISIPQSPILTPASIRGGILRTWGRKYMALVDGPATAQVHGCAYRVLSSEHEEYLRFRETEAYEVVRCCIALDSGEGAQEEVQGLTFRFRRLGELDADGQFP
ncbi:MAG: hypothetical protein LQ346_005512 [Caloplaca aetnensis]|nr:MAG: hypothetical protein LQ346_005512 [Caloplaca aetnensis]